MSAAVVVLLENKKPLVCAARLWWCLCAKRSAGRLPSVRAWKVVARVVITIIKMAQRLHVDACRQDSDTADTAYVVWNSGVLTCTETGAKRGYRGSTTHAPSTAHAPS